MWTPTLELRLRLSTCEIINHNTGSTIVIDKQGNNLYPIPPCHFYKDSIVPAPSSERLLALDRYEREDRVRRRSEDNMTALEIIQQSRRTEEERLRDEQRTDVLAYLNATSFEELDRRYENYERLKTELEDASTVEEIQNAQQRY